MYLLYLISSKNIVHCLSGQISFDLKPRYVHPNDALSASLDTYQSQCWNIDLLRGLNRIY